MIITGTVSLKKRTTHNKILNLLGDASYSIYLIHTVFSLRLSSIIWQQVPVEGWLQFTGWIILTLALSSAVGIIFYLYFEKPILKFLRRKWKVVANKKLSRNKSTKHVDSETA
jgi:peptidoglycan/LPS O-acetylase OafA/YrhL